MLLGSKFLSRSSLEEKFFVSKNDFVIRFTLFAECISYHTPISQSIKKILAKGLYRKWGYCQKLYSLSENTYLISNLFWFIGKYNHSIIWSKNRHPVIIGSDLTLRYSLKIKPFFHKLEIRTFCLDNGIKMVFGLVLVFNRISLNHPSRSKKIQDRITSDLSTSRIIDRSALDTKSYLPYGIHISITPSRMKCI